MFRSIRYSIALIKLSASRSSRSLADDAKAGQTKKYLVGVDVGTGSARAALVSIRGKLLKQSIKPIQIWNPEHKYYEQSSQDIWNAVCQGVQTVTADVPKEQVVAIAYDATCSLVVLGENGQPLSVSKSNNQEQNIILWMDHRAHAEAQTINATKHEILNYVGGQVSVEMEIPKLLWLKNHANEQTFSKIWRAFDLADFLTWRSTDCDARSLCCVVCKWNYDAMQMRWNQSYLQQIGLAELCRNDCETIGKTILEPGQPIGQGLSQRAAAELNLLPGTLVGTSLLDAHAGALAMFGCQSDDLAAPTKDIQGKLALICGTSTCHMSLTREPCHAKGIWGPYRSAILPEYFLSEGGQSATGLLLDHIIETHPQYMHLKSQIDKDSNAYVLLNNLLTKLATERHLDDICYLTRDLHVWPDYHGNRSPIADPTLKGMICGLDMNVDESALAILYLAFVQALAYGTRHIIEKLLKHKRANFTTLLFCGGLAKNPVYVQSHADICGLPAIIPDEQEMVLVGAAMLGACAAKVYHSLEEASNAMGGRGKVILPQQQSCEYHQRKYCIFLKMFKDQCIYKNMAQN